MKLIKRLLKVVVVLLVLLVIALVVAFIFIDRIAKAGVEYGATYALGVETKLDSASIGVFKGHFGMKGLNVANPQGFDSPHFLNMKTATVDVSLGSLRQDVVSVPTFELKGIDVYLQKKDGKTNYNVILDNLKKLESGKKTEKSESSKKFKVSKLRIAEVMVHVDLAGFGGSLTKMDVLIDEIVLNDIGSDGEGVKTEEIVNIVLKTVLRALAAKAGNLPGEFVKELDGSLAGLKSLTADGVKMAGDLGKQIGGLGAKSAEEVGKALEAVGKGLDDGIKDIGKGLGGLLGGDKKDEKK